MTRSWSVCLALPFFLALFATAPPVHAETCPDLPGFAPLEQLPVYDGACLFGADDPGFSSYPLPTGPIKGRALSSFETIEGDLQRRLYVAPEGASPLDVFSNYKNALVALDFETLFECAGRECGSGNALLGKLVIYGSDRQLRNLKVSPHAMYIEGDEYFVAARSADGTRHIAVYVARNQKAAVAGEASGRAAVHIDLVTAEALEARMVDAAAMAKGISDEGHIAVDNVFFDFGTAVLTPEAEPALAEMAKLLADNTDLSVLIVGHTDWVGNADANLALSQARAASVVAALVGRGIAANRVVPAGVGMLSPRASNASEEGRRLNRRVELVELGGKT